MLAGLEKVRDMIGIGSQKDIERIVIIYASREAERMEPVYQSLRERFPDRAEYFSSAIINPLLVYRRAYADNKNLRNQVISIRKSFVRDENYDGIGLIDNVMNSYEKYVEIFNAFRESVEDYYVRFARHIENISSERGMKPKDVVRDQNIVDDIERKIFPTRRDAKIFRETARKVAKEKTRLLNEFYDNFERWCAGHKPAWLPAAEEDDAITAEISKWREREYDRIYADEK